MGTVAILVLGAVFLLVVLPLWLLLHYATRWRKARGLSAEDERALMELHDSAKRMEARIATLETILDAEAPGWRRQA